MVYNPYLRRKFWMDNSWLANNDANEYTNYEMPLVKDEVVKIGKMFGDKVQIKKNGVIGWTYKKYLQL